MKIIYEDGDLCPSCLKCQLEKDNKYGIWCPYCGFRFSRVEKE